MCNNEELKNNTENVINSIVQQTLHQDTRIWLQESVLVLQEEEFHFTLNLDCLLKLSFHRS
jgi:hypothetical protein